MPKSAPGTLLLLIAATMGGCPVDGGGGAFLPLGADSAGGGQTAPAEAGRVGGSRLPAADAPTVDDFDRLLAEQFPGCQDFDQAEAYRKALMRLVNGARVQAGLEPVVRNETLERQATQYACEMITYGFFAHVNPVTGSTLGQRAREFGYPFQVIGENLAAGQQTPEQAFSDWMQSPGHRANILDPRFVELGIGIRSGGHYGMYWVLEFGLPLSAVEPETVVRYAP